MPSGGLLPWALQACCNLVGGESVVLGLALGLEITLDGVSMRHLAVFGFAAAGTTGAAGEGGRRWRAPEIMASSFSSMSP
jgi:hypothetical protein